MRAITFTVVAFAVISACGGGKGIADEVEPSIVRLAGMVCGVPVLAGGVVIGDGLVVTAAHVIAGVRGEVTVRFASGEENPGVVVGFDPERDLALVSVETTAPVVELRAAEPGMSGRIMTLSREGDVVETPFDVHREIIATGDDIYGTGDVARQAVELVADVDPGMSGGGAFDEAGHLVGIVFAESRTQPITYAIAVSEIQQFLAETDTSLAVDSGRC